MVAKISAFASNRYAPVLGISLIWLLCYGWHPWQLGLYHDDWATIGASALMGSAFSADRLRYFMQTFASRPTGGLTNYVLTSIVGGSPFGWQVLLSLGVLGVAMSLYRFFIAFGSVLSHATRWAAAPAAALWMLFPWNAASTTWPVMFHGLVATILFLEGCTLFLQQPSGWFWAPIAGLLHLAGYLAYESYYFQFAFLLVIASAYSWRFNPFRQWHWAISFTVAQIAAIAWNRWSAVHWGGNVKSINSEWKTAAVYAFQTANDTIFRDSLGIYYRVVVVSAALLAIAAFVGLIGRVNSEGWRPALRSVVVGIAVSAAFIAVVMLHVMVGYGLSGTGIMSRTTLGMNIWFCLIVYLLLASALSSRVLVRALQFSAGITTNALILSLILAYFAMVDDWRTSWNIQQAIISTAPVDALLHLPHGATVVLDAPEQVGAVPIFEAIWDINGAMVCTYPQLRSNFMLAQGDEKSTFTVRRPGNFLTSFDGKLVSQRWANNPAALVWQIPAQSVWLWKYPEGTVTQMSPGKEF